MSAASSPLTPREAEMLALLAAEDAAAARWQDLVAFVVPAQPTATSAQGRATTVQG